MLDCPLPRSLHYVEDSQPGLARRRWRDRFIYLDADGERVRDKDTLARIAALVIPRPTPTCGSVPTPRATCRPPAVMRVAASNTATMCNGANCATNTSRPHAGFAQVLPKLRAQLETYLARPGLDREKVMALVVSLLDHTLIRIGNQRYLRDNQSYGLTTLRNRHVEVKGSSIRFQFRGKRGVEHNVTLNDRRLANLLKRCMELPGQALFQYLDADGQRHSVGSAEVNQFLQQLTGADFTAKDYRTWAGSSLALDLLRPLAWGTGGRGQTPGGRHRSPGGHAPGQYPGGLPPLLHPPRRTRTLRPGPPGGLASTAYAKAWTLKRWLCWYFFKP